MSRIACEACHSNAPLEKTRHCRQRLLLQSWRKGGVCWVNPQGQALVLNAFAEIGVGFLLLLGLLSPARSILLTLIYWKNVLPVRYHSPDAASYHRQVCSRRALSEGLLSISGLHRLGNF